MSNSEAERTEEAISEKHGSDVEVAEQPAAVAPAPASEIPDGGWKAWTQVLGAHFLFYNSW